MSNIDNWQYKRQERKKEPPTEKQECFAAVISQALDIPMPAEYTKQAYSEYIEEWRDWLHG